jgi:hypothetical protein
VGGQRLLGAPNVAAQVIDGGGLGEPRALATALVVRMGHPNGSIWFTS